jgi:hypothetical protein
MATASPWYIVSAPKGTTGRTIFPTCQHGVCDATNVVNAIPGMNYGHANCAPAATGSTCEYQCDAGYSFAAVGAAASIADFTLSCGHPSSQFTDPNGAGGLITCTANACEEPLVAASGTWETAGQNPGVSYDDCTTPGKVSGSTCTPTCEDGYSPVNVASVKTLACGTNPTNGNTWAKNAASPSIAALGIPNTFQFDAATDLTCGRTCNWAVISTTTANADYSSCLDKGDGYACTPTCAAGFVATTAATGIVLNCDDGGSVAAPGLMVTPWSAADATLVCEAGVAPTAAPTAGPATAAPTTAAAKLTTTAAASAMGNPAPAPVPHTHTPTPAASTGNNGKAGKSAAPAPAPAAVPTPAVAPVANAKGGKEAGGKAGKDGNTANRHVNGAMVNAGKASKGTKEGKEAKGGSPAKGAKEALQQTKSSSAARKPVAYAASGVAVVVVLAAVVAIATKHGIGPLSTPTGDVEEGHPLNAPGVHPVYA